MAGPVTTSIVVSFTSADGEDGTLSAEIDDRPTGLNNGNTSFYPGDSPGFIVYKSTNVTLSALLASEGSVAALGTAVITKQQEVTFAKQRESSLSFPVIGGLTIIRKSPGAPDLTLVGQTKVTTPVDAVAVYLVEYQTTGYLYRLTGAAGDISVVVFIEGATS